MGRELGITALSALCLHVLVHWHCRLVFFKCCSKSKRLWTYNTQLNVQLCTIPHHITIDLFSHISWVALNNLPPHYCLIYLFVFFSKLNISLLVNLASSFSWKTSMQIFLHSWWFDVHSWFIPKEDIIKLIFPLSCWIGTLFFLLWLYRFLWLATFGYGILCCDTVYLWQCWELGLLMVRVSGVTM